MRICVCVCSVTSNSLRPPWTIAHQAPLSIGFSGQEYWSYHALLQGIFLTQGLNPCLLCLLHCRWILCHCTTWELCRKSTATCLTSRLPDTVYVGELIELTSISWGLSGSLRLRSFSLVPSGETHTLGPLCLLPSWLLTHYQPLVAAVHGVARSRTRLSDFTFTSHFHALEKEMATHSSVLARRIPRMGEPGGRPSMGSHRVGHDWSDLAAAAAVASSSNSDSWGAGF